MPKAFDWLPIVEKCCHCIPLHVGIVLITLHLGYTTLLDIYELSTPFCDESKNTAFSFFMVLRVLNAVGLFFASLGVVCIIFMQDILVVRQLFIYMTIVYVGLSSVYESVYLVFYLVAQCSSCKRFDESVSDGCDQYNASEQKAALFFLFVYKTISCFIPLSYYAIVVNSFPVDRYANYPAGQYPMYPRQQYPPQPQYPQPATPIYPQRPPVQAPSPPPPQQYPVTPQYNPPQQQSPPQYPPPQQHSPEPQQHQPAELQQKSPRSSPQASGTPETARSRTTTETVSAN